MLVRSGAKVRGYSNLSCLAPLQITSHLRTGTIHPEVLLHFPMRQWVLSVPHPLRFLFTREPKVMGKVLSIVYRKIASQLIRQAGLTRAAAHSGAVTLIQRFGSALTLNVHLHMLILDGVYVVSTSDARPFFVVCLRRPLSRCKRCSNVSA